MLRTINKKFTDLASAVAFAECGEWHTAQWFLGDFEAANKSSNRKFIVLCEDIDIDQAFMSYAANLSTRLCYDIIVLHAQRRNRSNSKKSSSLTNCAPFSDGSIEASPKRSRRRELTFTILLQPKRRTSHSNGCTTGSITSNSPLFRVQPASSNAPISAYRSLSIRHEPYLRRNHHG